MNPLALLGWWKEIVIALLVVALGVQSYRLQGAQGERDLLALEKSERARRDAMRDAANTRNKERADENHAAARARAGAVVVRIDGPGIKPKPGATAVGGNEPIACFDRGRLNEELAGWSARTAERLTGALRSHAGGLEGIARAGEGVAADFRSCIAWAVDLQ